MSGGTKTTSNVNSTQTASPYGPSAGLLQGILGGAQGLLGQTGISPEVQQALTGLTNNAQGAQGYAPDIQALTRGLFGGGGYGQGVPGIQNALTTTNANLTPFANGSMNDPTQNPGYQALVNSLKSSVQNSVGAQFSGARDGPASSPGALAAESTAMTNALAPYLFGQYNTNLQNQLGANAALNTNALNASGAYDASAGNRLNAQLQAPGSIANMNIPQGMALNAGQAPLQYGAQNLGTLSNLVLPIAQGFKSTNTQGTQTEQQQGNLAQTLAGGLLGGLGLIGGMGGFGPTGWLGSLLGRGTAVGSSGGGR